MGPLLAGILVLLLVFLLPMPYALHVIGLIVGAILVVYGLYVLLVGHTRTGRRWY